MTSAVPPELVFTTYALARQVSPHETGQASTSSASNGKLTIVDNRRNGLGEKHVDTEPMGFQPESEQVDLWEDYTDEIRRLCEMKADDFHLLGYEEVEPAEIWECVNSSLKGQVRLHDVVAGVLGLQVGKFMNWMTMQAYRGNLEGDASPFKF